MNPQFRLLFHRRKASQISRGEVRNGVLAKRPIREDRFDRDAGIVDHFWFI
ncbi:hypothetical protein J7E62_23195 [Variovorax paradoxus]|nr:hypothetical protein [Variovorax paradoxus]